MRLVAALLVLLGWVGAAWADGAAQIAAVLRGGRGFAHRTAHLEAVLKSGAVLSAHEAAKRGVLETHELPYRQRRRVPWDRRPHRLHTEVFGTTGGILPADAAYGKYGVVLESPRVTPSRYINSVPNEAVIEGQVSVHGAWFIVPREELAGWRARHPGRRFLAEDEVPTSLRLRGRDHGVLPGRLWRRLGDLLRLRVSPIAGKLAWQGDA